MAPFLVPAEAERKKRMRRQFVLVLVLLSLMAGQAMAVQFTDAHGNQIELDETLQAYTEADLLGAQEARKGETNLGDLWADALRWFATSGRINDSFEEDDVTAGLNTIAVEPDHVVALWNSGNLRATVPAGTFGAEMLAEVLPYPNKVAVVYMTGAQLTEALEAASQGLPYTEESDARLAALMQVSGLRYQVEAAKPYDAGEAYGDHWFRANSLGRVTILEVNGAPLEEQGMYAVITSNANLNGMDSSYIFKEAAQENEQSTITTAVVRDVVWQFLAEELGNHIGSEYEKPAGRIVLAE